jgi:hypothetical protein
MDGGAPGRCLGRLKPDAELLRRSPQFGAKFGAKRSVSSLDRRAIKFTPSIDDNNTLSDCTAVCVGNYARAAALIKGGFGIVIPTPKVVGFYSQSTGYDGTPATDGGGFIPRVLSSQAVKGFDIGDPNKVPLVGAWGTFDPADTNLMRNSMVETGAVDLGVALSMADQNTSGVWDINPPASAGDPTPGSWGLHSWMGYDFTGTEDTDTLRVGTWGYWQRVTWRWLKRAVEEAHSIAWRLFGVGVGSDYDTLVADGELFAGWLADA